MIADHVTGAHDHARTPPRFAAMHTWTNAIAARTPISPDAPSDTLIYRNFRERIFVAPASLV
jgi:hypothetical protein